jgi:hypothetical protein
MLLDNIQPVHKPSFDFLAIFTDLLAFEYPEPQDSKACLARYGSQLGAQSMMRIAFPAA